MSSTPPAPRPSPEQSLIAQYDLGDTQPNPALDLPPTPSEPVSGAFVPEPPAAASRPRGPDGRFLPKHLVQMAQDLGFSEEEISSTTADELQARVYHANRQALDAARQGSRDDLLRQSQERSLPSRTDTPPSQPPEEAYDLGIDESQFDENLVKAIKGIGRKYEQQIKELKDQLAEMSAWKQEQVNESTQAKVDRCFAKHKGILGEGRGKDMQANDPKFMRRHAVLLLVDQDQTQAPLQEKIDRAVQNLFGATATAEPTPPPQPASRHGPSPEEWAAGRLSRPTQRAGAAEPNGTAKAEKTAAAFMKEMGWGDEQGPSQEDFLGSSEE